MIEIQLNKDRLQVEEGSTLASLLEHLHKPPAALATAVNGEFVPRERRAGWPLRHGDVVLTFEPITGG